MSERTRRREITVKRKVPVEQIPKIIQEIANKGTVYFDTHPVNEVVPTIQAFTEGRMIKWSEPNAIEKTNEQLKPNGGLANAICRMLLSPSSETDLALDILTNDLRRFSPEESLLSSPDLPEWWDKFRAGTYLWMTSKVVSQAQNLEVPSPSIKTGQFIETVADQATGLTKTLKGVKVGDLTPYLHFSDLWFSSGFFVSNQNATALNRELTELGPDFSSQFSELNSEFDNAWKRIKDGWEWPQVREAVEALPVIHYSHVRFHLVAALESNLLDPQARIKPEEQEDLDIKGFMQLLKFRWADQLGKYPRLAEIYPGLTKHFDPPFEFSDVSAPRKHLPSTAISLLHLLANSAPTEALQRLLQQTQEQVEQDPESVTPWILTLTVLGSSHPVIGSFTDQAISNLRNAPELTRQILLHQQPGRLWLTPDGKIHPRGVKDNLQRGFLIFTSSAEEVIVTNQPTLKPQQEELALPEPGVLYQDSSVPFLGEVQLVRGDVKSFIQMLFQKNKLSPNLEQEFAEFDSLSQIWRRSSHDREFLYLHQLNPSDSHFKKAQGLVIEAVYVRGPEVMFVLKDNNIPKAVGGTMDKEGQLHLLDTDDSFIGEAEQLSLNNLVLHLTTQSLHKGGVIQAYEKNDRRAINAQVASWNRSERNGLPKIDLSANKPYIVTTSGGIKFPVVLAELSK